MAGDVMAVARALRGALEAEMHKLEHDLALYNYEKRKHTGSQQLFMWNSWARVGHDLSAARFGALPDGLLNVEWLNMHVLDVSGEETIIAVAPKHHTGLMLAVASRLPSAADEVAKLASIWGEDATARQQYWEPSTTPS